MITVLSLTLMVLPLSLSLTIGNPTITFSNNQQYPTLGEAFSMDCVTSALTDINITISDYTWYKNNRETSVKQRRYFQSRAQLTDSGKYACTTGAYNSFGELTDSISEEYQLTVIHLNDPTITLLENTTLPAMEGDRIVLKCNVEVPEDMKGMIISYRWKEDAFKVISTNSTIVMDPAQVTNHQYQCRVNGTVGTGEILKSVIQSVIVKAKPSAVQPSAVQAYANLTVICTQDKLLVYILKNYVDHSNFTFDNISCKSGSNDTHIMLTTKFTECGTTVTQTQDKLIYENIARSLPDDFDENALITRDNSEEIIIKCNFGRMQDTSMIGGFNATSDVLQITEEELGTFSIMLSLYKSQNFVSRYQAEDYPVSVKLKDRMFFELNLNTTNNALKLYIQSCYATMTSDYTDKMRYNIIENRCSKDKSYRSEQMTGTKSRFSIEAFKFLKSLGAIYMHCQSIICSNTTIDGRCSNVCQNRKRRSVENVPIDNKKVMSKVYVLSTKQIHAEGAGVTNKQDSNGLTTPIMLSIVGFLCVVVILLLRSKKNSENIKYMPVNTFGERNC